MPRKPSAKKRQPPKPKLNRAQKAKDNRKLGDFVIKASPGFSIRGTHKFNIFKRKGHIVVEYCEPCAKLRNALGIDGKKLPYVQSALNGYRGQTPANFNPSVMRIEFSELLKREYNIHTKFAVVK